MLAGFLIPFFCFIDQHYLFNESWLTEHVLALMSLSVEKCSELLIAQRDAFPIRAVVELLKENSHFLHHYLHNLYISDEEKLPPEYHDLQVVLYARVSKPNPKTSYHTCEQPSQLIVRIV